MGAAPLVLLLLLLLLALLIQHNNQVEGERAQTATRMLGQSDRIYDVLDRESQAIQKFIKTRNRARIGEIRRLSASLPAVLDGLGALVAQSGQPPVLYGRYRQLTGSVSQILGRYVDMQVAGESKTAAAYVASPAVAATLRAWRDAKSAFDRNAMNFEIASYNDVRRRNVPYQRAALVVCIGGSILTLLLFALFGTRIVRRLRRVAQNAEALSLGMDPAPVTGSDEIAWLDDRYRELTASLRRTIDEKESAVSAYRRERQIADALQRALLPQAFPRLNGLHVHTAYVSAESEVQVGGDWYDLFEIGDGIVGISVGDVAGHGIGAAALMSAVRQSVRSAARAAENPAVVLSHVNGVLCADEQESFVSALFATFDLRSGRLRYALAGHPPPIVVSNRYEAKALLCGGVLLGVDRSARFEECETSIDPGSSMIFYTDGLIEHRREPVEGIEELMRAAAAEARSPGSNPADGLHARILDGQAPKDDSAVMYLVYSHVLPDEERWRREWTFDARDEAAATRVKRAVFWQLADQVNPDDVLSIEIAYGELVANVARHTPGNAKVEVERRGDDVIVRVCDEGDPFELHGRNADSFSESGRGMFLVSTLAKDFSVDRHANGNCASIVFPARRAGKPISLDESSAALAAHAN